jgi:hypothetical protein
MVGALPSEVNAARVGDIAAGHFPARLALISALYRREKLGLFPISIFYIQNLPSPCLKRSAIIVKHSLGKNFSESMVPDFPAR